MNTLIKIVSSEGFSQWVFANAVAGGIAGTLGLPMYAVDKKNLELPYVIPLSIVGFPMGFFFGGAIAVTAPISMPYIAYKLTN